MFRKVTKISKAAQQAPAEKQPLRVAAYCRVSTCHEEQYHTVTGKSEWSTSTIDRMLSNEKYVGEVQMQKAYISDFLTGKRGKNEGQIDTYLVKNAHEPIIDRKTFELVQKNERKHQKIQHLILKNIQPAICGHSSNKPHYRVSLCEALFFRVNAVGLKHSKRILFRTGIRTPCGLNELNLKLAHRNPRNRFPPKNAISGHTKIIG